MFSTMFWTLLLLASSVSALTVGLDSRATMTTLADGTSMKYGTLSNGLKWQSSGKLAVFFFPFAQYL